MKAFPAYTREQVRNEISYANLMFMLMAIPPYRSYTDKHKLRKGKTELKERKIHWEQFKF